MRFKINQSVDADADQVFNVFSDIAKASERVDGIERIELLTEPPIGRGTQFNETRIMFGRESTEHMEITEYVPGKMYAVEAETCGAHFKTTFRFSPTGGRTDVEMETQTTAISLFAKLMAPLGFLMAGSMKKMMLDDIRQLKEYCERNRR